MPTKKFPRPRRPERAEEAPPEDLRDEIELLRVIIRRVSLLADEGRTLEELLRVLNTTSIACTRLAGLIKAQHSLEEDSGTALSEALKAVLSDMRTKRAGALPPQD
jgi:hypothetical protein